MARIKTIHGVPVPPRKKKPGRERGQKFFTLDFILTGPVPSKKNRQIATINRLQLRKIIKDLGARKISVQEALQRSNEVKPYIRHSKGFYAWEERAKETILRQAEVWISRLRKKGHELYYPIPDASITIYHYWKDQKIRDNSGKAETLHDLFVAAGILTDDAWQNLTPTHADADCYEEEVTHHITEILITAYNWK